MTANEVMVVAVAVAVLHANSLHVHGFGALAAQEVTQRARVPCAIARGSRQQTLHIQTDTAKKRR